MGKFVTKPQRVLRLAAVKTLLCASTRRWIKKEKYILREVPTRRTAPPVTAAVRAQGDGSEGAPARPPAPPAGSPPPPEPEKARPRGKGRVPPAPCAGPRGRSGPGGRRSDPAALPGAAREAAASSPCRYSRWPPVRSRSSRCAGRAPLCCGAAPTAPYPAQRDTRRCFTAARKAHRAGARPASRRAPCRAVPPQRGLLRGRDRVGAGSRGERTSRDGLMGGRHGPGCLRCCCSYAVVCKCIKRGRQSMEQALLGGAEQ